jgi:ATP-dependent RNA helicase DOB1
VVNVMKKPSPGVGALPSRGGGYIVDTLLHCSPGSSESSSRPKPCPPHPGEKGEMHVVSRNVCSSSSNIFSCGSV